MRKILLTGATGFIGSHLLHGSVLDSFDVFALVRNEDAQLPEGVVPVLADFREKGWAKELPVGIDTIIHLAQSRLHRDFPEGSRDLKSVNVDATFELLEWARMEGVADFLLASTGNVCGPVSDCETCMPCCEPQSMYAATKLCAERLAMQYAKLFRVAIFRLFTVYGPGQRGALVPTIIGRILDGTPIDLAGGQGLVLSPLHVEDVCAGVAKLVESEVSGIMHWAGTEVLNLHDMAESIGRALGIEAKYRIAEGEPLQLYCKTDELMKFAGSPRDFDEGIKSTAREYLTTRRQEKHESSCL